MAIAMVPLERECALPLCMYILVHVCHQRYIVHRKTCLIVDNHCWVSISVYHMWLRLCTVTRCMTAPVLVEMAISGVFRFLVPFQRHPNQWNVHSRRYLCFIQLFGGTVVRVFVKLQFPLPSWQMTSRNHTYVVCNEWQLQTAHSEK